MAASRTLEQLLQYHRLLLAERRRRNPVGAGEDERLRQQFLDTLQAMAQRFAALAPLHPLDLADMSVAERLACCLLPDELRPTGLGTEAEIWAEYTGGSTGP